MLPPYTMRKDFYAVNKDTWKSISCDIGDYSYDAPRVPLDDLRKKPQGKAGEA
jgi:hypothetical protein